LRVKSREPEGAGSRLLAARVRKEFAVICANGDTSVCRRSAGALMLRARLVDGAGRPIRAADVAAVDLSIRSVESNGTVEAFEMNPCELLLPTLAIDPAWTTDEIGYNFRHDLTAVLNLIDITPPEFDGRVEVRYTFTLIDCAREVVMFYLKLG